MEETLIDVQSRAIDAAKEHIKEQRSYLEHMKFRTRCMTVLLAIAIVAFTVLGIFMVYAQQQTIREQQYALNMQYAELMEYIANAEVTTEVIDGGEGGVTAKVEGDGNAIGGN